MANGGNASRTISNRIGVTVNNVLSGDWSFQGDHNISALAGQEFYTYTSHWDYGWGDGIMEIGKYQLSSTTRAFSAQGARDQYALMSFFGKLDYNFRNKYYLSGSVRQDGSSRFHPDNRWGTFGSIGASWRITEEAFMDGITWMDNLSLRASYGTTGNDRLIPRRSDSHRADPEILYGYQATYEANNLYQVSGLKPATYATPELRWESNHQWNVGVDFLVFRRVSGTIEYFSRESRGLLFYQELPTSARVGRAAGFNTNIGDLRNSGIEITINANVVTTSDFRWTIDANKSTLKNEVTRMAVDPFNYVATTSNYRMDIGYSIFEFIALQHDGVNPQTGLNGWLVRDGDGWERTELTTVGGPDDMVRVGSAIPKGYGAVTNNFFWKGFDFSFMLYFSYGSYLYDYTYRERKMNHNGIGITMDLVKDRWRKPGDNAMIPRWSDSNLANTHRVSSFYVMPNPFMRLRNMTLGYTLPTNISQRAGIDNLRLYATTNNLFTLGPAARRWTEPESGVQGNNYNANNDTDTGIQGARRIYMVGLQMTL